MLYRTMPKTREPLSILGFGCMRLPQKNRGIDETAALELIDIALEKGVTYFDTAVPYHMGASEPFLGRALARDNKRSKVKIATKLPHWQTHSVRDMEAVFASQLEHLQTDVIDYYLVHSLNASTWIKAREAGVLDFLDQARRDGRIRFAGFSYHGTREGFSPIVDAYTWDFCQIQYNILDEQNQAGTAGLEYAASKGLGVIVMEPLRGGNLARTPPAEIQSVWNRSETKRSPAEWALRWVWNRPEVSVVLSGMNHPDQLKENLKIADEALPGSLTGEELSLVSEAAATYRKLMKVGCTGCQYCLPCPAGVDIPGCFESYNSLHLFQDPGASGFYLIRMGGAMGKPAMASQCIRCGACVRKCPQSIPIPDILPDVAKAFEGRLFKPKVWAVKTAMKLQRLWTLFKNKKKARRQRA
ncbi:MAG TPA: aldo/keto reductase [Candidatus Ozemobacteraceae bacterium]|nr:aldo/keto reductase [Candidatus Ozemobacteraceae bacterium]